MRHSLTVVVLLVGLVLVAPCLLAQSGSLDAAGCGVITGWAWDGIDADKLNVDILSGPYNAAPSQLSLVRVVTANLYRSDLQAAGVGSGYHAYTFFTPPSLKDNVVHYIYVRVTGTNVFLGGSDVPIQCPPNSTGYQYYYSESFASAPSPNWNLNGTLTESSATGMTNGDAIGGSLISSLGVPDGSSDYEVKETVRITQNTGNFVIYLHATPGSLLTGGNQGTYYAAVLTNVQCTGNNCMGIPGL